MTTLTAIPADAEISRIAGVDVGQLLRDLGEASACTSPIELFRLCLSAQCVLVQVAPGGGAR
jgi:hypothetical protein